MGKNVSTMERENDGFVGGINAANAISNKAIEQAPRKNGTHDE